MWFDDVIPGEPVTAESASRYNAINELLRDWPGVQGASGTPVRNGTLDLYNDSDGVIGRFTAVSLDSVYRGSDPESLAGRWDGSCIISGSPATDDERPWAVALEDIAPGDFGRVTVSGTVPAFFTGEGSHAAPSADGLTAGDSGNALILLPTCLYGGVRYPGLIVMGGGGGAAPVDDYAGIFKMVAISSTQLEVVYGPRPTESYCGHTDVPGLYAIPRTVVEVTAAGRQKISLQFFYTNRSYSYQFCVGTVPAEAVFGIELGYFNNGSVTQTFRYNTAQYLFGNDWYLT